MLAGRRIYLGCTVRTGFPCRGCLGMQASWTDDRREDACRNHQSRCGTARQQRQFLLVHGASLLVPLLRRGHDLALLNEVRSTFAFSRSRHSLSRGLAGSCRTRRREPTIMWAKRRFRHPARQRASPTRCHGEAAGMHRLAGAWGRGPSARSRGVRRDVHDAASPDRIAAGGKCGRAPQPRRPAGRAWSAQF